jgi:glycosyltransferase involved in cell wall biosynthesis
MRIFHGIHNISGIPGVISAHERAIGLSSWSLCFSNGYGFKADETLMREDMTTKFNECAIEFDVFNLNFGYGFFDQSLADYEYIKKAGKIVNTFFHGCDIRDSKRVIREHKVSACQACWPAACNANRNIMRHWATHNADNILVSTPDLLEFFDRAQWLPQAVEVSALRAKIDKRSSRRTRRRVRIAHAPSSPLLKGTAYVREAIASLQAVGEPIDFVELTGMPHADILKAIAASDFVIDQLLIGAYGVVSIEAMSLGKPTICYIRDDLLPLYPPDLPIIRASIHNLRDVIADLLLKRDRWPELGLASARYAERVHDASAVAQRMKSLYEKALTCPITAMQNPVTT